LCWLEMVTSTRCMPLAMFVFLHFVFALLFILFFFFQAEDGIRDKLVTGVQTCALPISFPRSVTRPAFPVRGRLAILTKTTAGRVTMAAFGLCWHGFDHSEYSQTTLRQAETENVLGLKS